MSAIRQRWSDNDKYFGPLTYSKDDGNWRFAAVLDSGDDEYPGCSLRLQGFGNTLILALPAIIKPWRQWIDTSMHEWSTSDAGGYWDDHSREYGFSVSEGYLQVFLGAQTGDSSTTQSWSKFLPWTEWRFVRHSLYDLNGDVFWTQMGDRGIRSYDELVEAEKRCPCKTFAFADYDDEKITAETHIEEIEWLSGVGWFKWLSWVRSPKISRSLDIRFSSETGQRKGSWKGGTLGHGIEMQSGELHEDAFKRYCIEHGMTFIGEPIEGKNQWKKS